MRRLMMGCVAGAVAGFGPTDFSYTGSYTWVQDDTSNWRLKFLSGGTFTPAKTVDVDAFLVGGGGGGGQGSVSTGGGGGGGYTTTVLNIRLYANTAYTIEIGEGGAPNEIGGTTSAFGSSAFGGVYGGHNAPYNWTGNPGGAGGSGGGAGGDGAASTPRPGQPGGYNGGNGGSGYNGGQTAGGAGQGTTTREFAEAEGYLYSGGGGGGAYYSTLASGAGGDGGGGYGFGLSGAATAGVANTGGGGGGSSKGTNYGASGGSGILIIRNRRG